MPDSKNRKPDSKDNAAPADPQPDTGKGAPLLGIGQFYNPQIFSVNFEKFNIGDLEIHLSLPVGDVFVVSAIEDLIQALRIQGLNEVAAPDEPNPITFWNPDALRWQPHANITPYDLTSPPFRAPDPVDWESFISQLDRTELVQSSGALRELISTLSRAQEAEKANGLPVEAVTVALRPYVSDELQSYIAGGEASGSPAAATDNQPADSEREVATVPPGPAPLTVPERAARRDKRIRTALVAARLLAHSETEGEIGRWFVRRNGYLGSQAPARALREDRLDDVLNAAELYAFYGG